MLNPPAFSLPPTAALLPTLLATVPAGVALLAPAGPADFTVAYLNPAARQLLRPAKTELPAATVG